MKLRDESYSEFLYNLRVNLTKWLKGPEFNSDRDAVVERILLEQFYNRLPEQERNWL